MRIFTDILQTADKGGLCRNLYFSHNAHSHLRQTKESAIHVLLLVYMGKTLGTYVSHINPTRFTDKDNLLALTGETEEG